MDPFNYDECYRQQEENRKRALRDRWFIQRVEDLVNEIDRQNKNPNGFDVGKVNVRAEVVRALLDPPEDRAP